MGIRKRLLATPAERVPDGLAAAVAAFCEPLAAIRAAYAGLVEVTEGSDRPREQLAVAFELDEVDEQVIGTLAARFGELLPADVQAGGCNVLAGGAIGPWSERARRVFTRAAGGVP